MKKIKKVSFVAKYFFSVFIKWSIVAIIMMSLIIVLFSFSACGDAEKATKDPIKPVKYVIIGNNNDAGTKTFNGLSKSGSETKLSFRSNGLIVLLDAKNGEKVSIIADVL